MIKILVYYLEIANPVSGSRAGLFKFSDKTNAEAQAKRYRASGWIAHTSGPIMINHDHLVPWAVRKFEL